VIRKQLLFICGFMGSGKTTHGKEMAQQIGYGFIDLDDYIIHKHHKSITELFKEIGEDEFRNKESEALNECINNNSKAIIATGGGTPCFNKNLSLMKSCGILIYLKLNKTDLFNRLRDTKNSRPLIKDKNNEVLLLYIENLLKIREVFYNQADITVNGNKLDIISLKENVLTLIDDF
jgi:shikimate kinase